MRYFEVAATSSVQATPGGAAPAPRGVCIRIVIGDGLGQHNWDDPGFKDWGAKWGALMSWLIGLEHFRSSLKIGPGGETGPVNDMVRHASERLGANIMGRRMFEAGERGWPEEVPFHTPVFVLTHRPRPSIEMEGGTTFHFLNASPAEALKTAREAAVGQDTRLGGGPSVVRDFLAEGLVDHMHLVQVPIVLGRGVRLWDGLESLEEAYNIEAVSTPSGVTHLTFTAKGR